MAAYEFPTIESFGLERVTVRKKMAHEYRSLYRGATLDWADQDLLSQESTTFEIRDPDPNGGDIDVEYSMHVGENTFIAFSTFLTEDDQEDDLNPPVRFTEMRLCMYKIFDPKTRGLTDAHIKTGQMLGDSWLQGGGEQPNGPRDGLRYLAYHTVVQTHTKKAMKDEMISQMELAESEGSLEVPFDTYLEWTPESPYWRSAVFINSALTLARNMSTPTQRITMTRAFIVPDWMGTLPIHLICEFTVTAIAPDPENDEDE